MRNKSILDPREAVVKKFFTMRKILFFGLGVLVATHSNCAKDVLETENTGSASSCNKSPSKENGIIVISRFSIEKIKPFELDLDISSCKNSYKVVQKSFMKTKIKEDIKVAQKALDANIQEMVLEANGKVVAKVHKNIANIAGALVKLLALYQIDLEDID